MAIYNTENKTYTGINLKSSVELTVYRDFSLKFVLKIQANVISNFIFIQPHEVNMEKTPQLFLDAFLNLDFSAILKKHFHASPVRKSMQGL